MWRRRATRSCRFHRQTSLPRIVIPPGGIIDFFSCKFLELLLRLHLWTLSETAVSWFCFKFNSSSQLNRSQLSVSVPLTSRAIQGAKSFPRVGTVHRVNGVGVKDVTSKGNFYTETNRFIVKLSTNVNTNERTKKRSRDFKLSFI